jgi:hypothetical protein
VSEEELRNSSGAHVGVEEQDNHEQEEEEGCNQNDMVDDEMNEEYNLKDILEEEMNEDNLSQSGSINSAEIEKDLQEWEVMMEKEKMENEKPSVEGLAAIPEASPAQASARRGKRRADDDGAEVAAKAERLKALRNEGNDNTPPLNNNVILSNLDSIGISVGSDVPSVQKSVSTLKCSVGSRGSGTEKIDRKTFLLEQEGKNMLEEEELRKSC